MKEVLYRISKDFEAAKKEELKFIDDEIDITKKAIEAAREQGDLSENFDFQSNRDKYAKLEHDKNDIIEILNHCAVVPISYYKYENLSTKDIYEVTIVDPIESDLFTLEAIIPISNKSGIARQISNHEVGDIIDIRKTENGPVEYQVKILAHDPDYSKNK